MGHSMIVAVRNIFCRFKRPSYITPHPLFHGPVFPSDIGRGLDHSKMGAKAEM